jgi:small subunit ribosomal protein S6
MRIYEELFIVRPDATEEEVDPLIEQIKGVITHAGGTIEKAEKWGMRKLAYRVSKHNEGQYVLLVFNAKADTVKELERRLRVSDMVIKFLTVRIDEKLKRIEKRKKAREKRALRKPAPQPQQASVNSVFLPGEPHSAVPGAPAPPLPATPAPPPPAVPPLPPSPEQLAEPRPSGSVPE